MQEPAPLRDAFLLGCVGSPFLVIMSLSPFQCHAYEKDKHRYHCDKAGSLVHFYVLMRLQTDVRITRAVCWSCALTGSLEWIMPPSPNLGSKCGFVIQVLRWVWDFCHKGILTFLSPSVRSRQPPFDQPLDPLQDMDKSPSLTLTCSLHKALCCGTRSPHNTSTQMRFLKEDWSAWWLSA